MTWGDTNNISTTNCDSGTDSPALFRADIKAALDELINVINGRGVANGVASLDANSQVPAGQMPDEINTSTGSDLTLDPDTSVVQIESVLRLTPITASTAYGLATLQEGMCAFISNQDSTEGRPAYYSSSGEWKYFADNTIVPNV